MIFLLFAMQLHCQELFLNLKKRLKNEIGVLKQEAHGVDYICEENLIEFRTIVNKLSIIESGLKFNGLKYIRKSEK